MDFSKRQLVVLCLQYVDDNMNIHTEYEYSQILLYLWWNLINN